MMENVGIEVEREILTISAVVSCIDQASFFLCARILCKIAVVMILQTWKMTPLVDRSLGHSNPHHSLYDKSSVF